MLQKLRKWLRLCSSFAECRRKVSEGEKVNLKLGLVLSFNQILLVFDGAFTCSIESYSITAIE